MFFTIPIEKKTHDVSSEFLAGHTIDLERPIRLFFGNGQQATAITVNYTKDIT